MFSDVDSTGNLTGIAITASSGNVVRGSALTDNEFTGALLFGASHTRVEGNRIAGNIANGIAIVEGSAENPILGNAVQGSDTGLIVDSSARNLLSLNKVSGAGDGVLVAGDANTVAGNLVERSVGGCEGCSGFGIGILAGAKNIVSLNIAQRNATDGINVAAAGTDDRAQSRRPQRRPRDRGGSGRARRRRQPRVGQRKLSAVRRRELPRALARTPRRSARRSAGGRRGRR